MATTNARTMTRARWIAAGATAIVLVAGGTGIAIAGGGDTDERLTGSTLDQASAAALEFTGGGTVTESEVGDGGAAYSVEVRLDDGTQVEVSLDRDFDVVGHEGDDDGADVEQHGDD